MKGELMEAIRLHFLAKKSKAIATFNVYKDNAVGIGEHPQIVDEMIALIEEITNAEDCLNTIHKFINDKI